MSNSQPARSARPMAASVVSRFMMSHLVRELRLLDCDEMLAEESERGGVEVLVEGQAVKARRIDAVARKGLRQFRRAGREERPMRGTRHEMKIGFEPQLAINRSDAFERDAGAAIPGAPELNRDRDLLEVVRSEQEGERRIGDSGGLDARIKRRYPVRGLAILE